MLVRVPLQLKRDRHGDVPSDASIRAVFVALGYLVRNRQGGEDEADQGGGTPEHRGRASRNVNANMRANAKTEIEQYCIFYGASSGTRCEIFVNRINTGEVVIWLFQARLDELLLFSERLCAEIAAQGKSIFVLPRSLRERKVAIELYSDTLGALIAEGEMQSGNWRTAIGRRPLELAGLLITTAFALLAFSLVAIFPEPDMGGRDVLGEPIRIALQTAWPTLLVAALTFLLTLVAAVVAASRKVTNWRWY